MCLFHLGAPRVTSDGLPLAIPPALSPPLACFKISHILFIPAFRTPATSIKRSSELTAVGGWAGVRVVHAGVLVKGWLGPSVWRSGSIPGPQNEVLESQGLWGGHRRRACLWGRGLRLVRWAAVSAQLGAVGQPHTEQQCGQKTRLCHQIQTEVSVLLRIS